MKRIFTTILTCALALGGISLLPSVNRSRANADEPQTGAELFLPTSYEQYLPLENPTDVAIGENHLAVADGKNVYVYSSATGNYDVYAHSSNVTKLQFSGDKLYFLSLANNGCFFEMNANDLPDSPLPDSQALQHCNSFVISSDTVYFTSYSENMAQISSAPLDEPQNSTPRTEPFYSVPKPTLAVADGSLYYTKENDDARLILLGDASAPKIDLPDRAITSIAIQNGVVYYTAASGFYAYALSDLKTNEGNAQPIFKDTIGNYSSLRAADDGYIYAVCSSFVCRYAPEEKRFDDYVIASASDKINRLSSATDITLGGDYLFASDPTSRRISVTDLKANKTSAISVDFPADKIATDGKTLLAANATQAALYDLSTYEPTAKLSFASDVVGVTNVYGTYYFATKTGFCKLIDENKLSPTVAATQGTPCLLASDVYGSLYVGYASGSLFSYTEEEFLNAATLKTESDKIATLPLDTEKLLVDFDRNLYALKDRKLHVFKNGAETVLPLAKSLVYSQTDETAVTSICFGATENVAYLLYDGTFIAKTDEFSLPNMRAIAVSSADETVFGETNDFSLVKINPDALYVLFDIHALHGAEYFPYLSHTRGTNETVALRLGETDKFNLVAVFDNASRKYSTALVEKSSCPENIDESEYLKTAERFSDNPTGYVTNALPLYKYPYLTDLLVTTQIPKNAKVTVLGQIDDLDYKYYKISYVDAESVTHVGYLPQNYLSEYDGQYPESEKITVGMQETDLDSVWRAAFILLGFAAIAVLVDFLILRKKH